MKSFFIEEENHLVCRWTQNFERLYLITLDQFNEKPVIKGGKQCVLLGKTILKSTMDEKAGIMTWVDKDHLTLISWGIDVEPEKESCKKYYRVQAGAFSEKKSADVFISFLKKADLKPT